jgi:hypothetical protein
MSGARMLLVFLLAFAPLVEAAAVELPAEGSCPPYPIRPGEEAPDEDVVSPLMRPGQRIDLQGLERLESYLPREVWERRDAFFFEGMRLEIGPCHRRYRPAPYFEEASSANAGRVSIDENGGLVGYPGIGLPFPTESIADDAPDAGQRWAWDYRYRWAAAGFRGDFRIMHIARRGRTTERYLGSFFWLPVRAVPAKLRPEGADGQQFTAGGAFTAPFSARGVVWRQFRPEETDRDYKRSDEIFVWVPEERKVKRSAPIFVEGLFMPSYTRGSSVASGKLQLPDASISTPDVSVGVTEHWRRGFVGLFERPNVYKFRFLRVHDVLAPINTLKPGYPAEEKRSYGPSGLSVADDRWDVRRAVVIEGTSRLQEQPIAFFTLWVDVQTLQPLYIVTRRPNRAIQEVGIFVGRFTADDPIAPKWEGSGADFGVIAPVAQTFWVAGDEGWLRESFEVRTDPPDAGAWVEMTTTGRMQQSAK